MCTHTGKVVGRYTSRPIWHRISSINAIPGQRIYFSHPHFFFSFIFITSFHVMFHAISSLTASSLYSSLSAEVPHAGILPWCWIWHPRKVSASLPTPW